MLFQLRKGRRWEADKKHRTGERLAKDGERQGEGWGVTGKGTAPQQYL